MNAINHLKNLDCYSKRVIVRVDLNVPIDDKGNITSNARILAVLPTIRYLLSQNATILLLSHLGRPVEGCFDEKYSLKNVANALGALLTQTVHFLPLHLDFFENTHLSDTNDNTGNVYLCENVRFLPGETSNDLTLSKKLAQLGDIFVMDAFATAHRAHASTCGIAQQKNHDAKCMGLLVEQELSALTQISQSPKRPLLAIVGGSKISTKLSILKSLAEKVDMLIVGGGIANTFLKAQGYPIGHSLCEDELMNEARNILQTPHCQIPLPLDVRVSNHFSADATATIKAIDEVVDDDLILDIGPKTEQIFTQYVQNAQTILVNGPVGVFEFDAFGSGTTSLFTAIANSSAFSVAGGGDTIAALEKNHLQNQISYISTAGGAFLEFIEGKLLPGIEALKGDALK